MAVVKQVRRHTITQQIVEALMDGLMDGTLQMGQRLRTQDLADQLGVSRMPVREALISMQANGLVEVTPYAGYRVAALEPGRLREMYTVRRALEPIIARQACERMTSTQFDEVESRFRELEKAALNNRPDGKRIFESNREFHFALYECAEMPHITEILWNTWDRLAMYKFLHGQRYLADRSAAEQMVEEHRDLVDAIRLRDGDRLAELLADSISRHESELSDLEELNGSSA